ncbi:MAG: site-specific integrase, partial [Flavitalea sp.]
MWEPYKKGFKAYLQLEKSLSENSIEAYLHDIDKLTQYLTQSDTLKNPADLELIDLQCFITWIGELGMTASSQARIISGIRAFYKYCLLEQVCTKDPSLLLETPRLKRALPDVLSFDEIEKILN